MTWNKWATNTHVYDTIYTHFQGINGNIYGFGRSFFFLLPRPSPVHPYFCPFIFGFTRPNDGWTGLYIKLCLWLTKKVLQRYTLSWEHGTGSFFCHIILLDCDIRKWGRYCWKINVHTTQLNLQNTAFKSRGLVNGHIRKGLDVKKDTFYMPFLHMYCICSTHYSHTVRCPPHAMETLQSNLQVIPLNLNFAIVIHIHDFTTNTTSNAFATDRPSWNVSYINKCKQFLYSATVSVLTCSDPGSVLSTHPTPITALDGTHTPLSTVAATWELSQHLLL